MTFCRNSGSIPSGTTHLAVHPKRGPAADTLNRAGRSWGSGVSMSQADGRLSFNMESCGRTAPFALAMSLEPSDPCTGGD